MSTPPTTARRIDRRGALYARLGGYALMLGVLGTLLGVVMPWLQQAARVVVATARTEVPGTTTFEADGDRYVIVLLPAPLGAGVPGDPVAGLVCEVTRADGTTATVRGARQDSSLETDFGRTVGDFATVPGPTLVDCAFPNAPRARRYYVSFARQGESVERIWRILLVGGLLLGGAGVGLFVVAHRRGRRAGGGRGAGGAGH